MHCFLLENHFSQNLKLLKISQKCTDDLRTFAGSINWLELVIIACYRRCFIFDIAKNLQKIGIIDFWHAKIYLKLFLVICFFL